MGSVFIDDSGRLSIKFKTPAGQWAKKRTRFTEAEREKAERLLRRIEEGVANERPFATAGGDVTIASFATEWMKARVRTVSSWKDDQSRLDRHILPALGSRRLDELRAVEIRDFVRDLREKGLAPRTIRNVYFLLRALYAEAVMRDLVVANPCQLRRVDIGKVRDADPAWRTTARFTAEEAHKIVVDEHTPADRRVLYALMFLAGLRFGEASALRWADLVERKPLSAILVHASYNTRLKRTKSTKTETDREVPVHPLLAKVLEAWRAEGFAAMFGREPRPRDLLVPSREWKNRSANHMLRRFHGDLQRIGIPARRQHDARRTFFSLARNAGADEGFLKWITHGRPEHVGGLYTDADWTTLCAIVGLVNIGGGER